MHIIPAIDIIDGKCVRLTKGDYSQQKVYNEDPLELALAFEDHGLQRLHVVDLDGARSKRIVNYRTLERIASRTGLHIDFGGGLKSDDDLRIAFECGAHQVTGGTVAAREPDLFLRWLERYGSERIILGADARHGKIAVSGWQDATGLHLFDFLEDYAGKGVKYAICTDIERDGLLQGSAIDLYGEIRARFPDLCLIASGGVTTLDELGQLREIGCFGAIVGKAIYEGKIGLKELKQFL